MSNPQIDPTINQIGFPLRQANVYLYDSGAPENHNIFAGVSETPGAPSNDYFAGSFMSHLGLIYSSFPSRQQFSPGKYLEYVMKPVLYTQILRRHWSLPETRLLLNLGYELNTSFAMGTNLSPPYTNAEVVENSPPFRSDYADPEDRLSYHLYAPYTWEEYTEVLPADFTIVNSNTLQNPTNSVLVMDISQDPTLVDKDGDDVFVRPEEVFGIRGVTTGGNNHNLLILGQNGKVFTYTPEPGFYGRAEFGFYLTDGKETGAMEVYSIEVVRDQDISYPDDQELIINGDFEDGIEVKTWEEPDKVYTSHYLVNAQPQLHYGIIPTGGGFPFSKYVAIKHSLDNWPQYAGSGADNDFGSFGTWYTHCPSSFVSMRPSPSTSTTNNQRYAVPQNIIASLIAPIEPSKYYELKFEVGPSPTGNEIGQELSGMVVHIISEPEYIPGTGVSYNILQTIDPDITVEELFYPFQPEPWQPVSVTFQYCGSQDAHNLLFEYYYYSSSGPTTYFDNLSDQTISPNCDPYEAQMDIEIIPNSCDYVYSWTPITGLSDPSIPNPTASPSQTTTYTITVTNTVTSESASDQVTVFVTEPLEFTAEITVCPTGDKINLFDYVNPDGGIFTGEGVTGNQFDPGIGIGEYEITYYLNDGCDGTASIIVTVAGYDYSTASHPYGLHVYSGDANDGGTLSGDLQFLQPLVIHDGATFNLTNAHIEFIENKGVNILAGGRLNIIDSHLKNLDCADHWRGVYVYGNNNYSQSGQDVYEQGRCYLENTEIENAISGITNYGSPYYNSSDHGGIIKAIDVTFKNCRISTDLRNYQNMVNGNELPIRCEFYNCHYIWDNDFRFIDDIENPVVYLDHVFRVKFSGCEFTNTHPGLFSPPNNHYRKAAIYADQASINISRGCTGPPPYAFNTDGSCISGDEPSLIEGFNYGIVLRAGAGSSVTKTTFRCYRGLWAYKAMPFRLTQNNFQMLPINLAPYAGQTDPAGGPMWNIPYGAYIDHTPGFWIEGNTFNIASGTPSAGLFVRNSGSNYNQIYRNTFSNNQFGLVAYDENRGPDYNKGLKILCNTYSNNTADNWVLSTTNPPYSEYWGISPYQGVPPVGIEPGISAGNKFLDQPVVNLYNSLEWVNYYYHQSENVTSTFGVTEILVQDEHECPSSFGSPLTPELMSEKQSEAGALQNEADSVGTVLQTIIDGGNTQALLTDVILAEFGDALELYYELMQKSPNLSKEVMVEAIQKEYELPAPLLTLILNANPHAAKLSDIRKELDQRLQQLTENQRLLIDEGLDLTSYKEGLEARRSRLENAANTLVNRIVMEVLADTTGMDKIQAIETYTSGFDSPQRQYLLADLALQKGDVATAQTRLDAVADLALTDEQAEGYADFLTVYGIEFDLHTSGDSTLSVPQFQTLENLMLDKPNSPAAAKSTVLLEAYAGFEFHEVLVEPDWQNKSNKTKRGKFKVPEVNVCRVYPNPTEGILLVEVPSKYDEINAELVDATGRSVLTAVLTPGRTGLATLNLRNLSSGAYILHLTSVEGKLDEVHRVNLAK